jgi:hypothetical protein
MCLDPKHRGAMPQVACVMVGSEYVTFGASLRSSRKKNEIQAHRLAELMKALPHAELDLPRSLPLPLVLQKFGHCAETYPVIFYLQNPDGQFQPFPNFQGSVHGFAIDAKSATYRGQGMFNYEDFTSSLREKAVVGVNEKLPEDETKKKGKVDDGLQNRRSNWIAPCRKCCELLGWGYDCS